MSSDNETPGGRSPRARKTTVARRPAAPRSRTGTAERADRGEGERLQKVLAQAGIASRRAAEELIRAGRVTVNGQPAQLGDRVDLSRDAVKVDDQRLAPPPPPQHYLLLNKPKGYLSTRQDPVGRPTVMDLIPAPLRPLVAPVGRLDFDTEGLLLLTDDGELANRIAHPRYGCHKTYEVKVKGSPSEAAVAKLRRGVVLDGKRTLPAEVDLLRRSRPREGGERQGGEPNTWWRVVLSEGRSRQIREMFFRIGHPVQRLRRVAVGPIQDPALLLGSWRELSEPEVAALRRATAQVVPRPSRGAAAATRAGGPPKRATGDKRPTGDKRATGEKRATGASRATARPAPEGRAGRAGGGGRGAARPDGAPRRGGGARPAGGRATGGRVTGGRPSRERPTEGRPTGGPATGGRPTRERPTGGRPTGGTGGRPPRARPTVGRPAGSRPAGERSTGGRPAGSRPAGGRPTGGRRSGPGGRGPAAPSGGGKRSGGGARRGR